MHALARLQDSLYRIHQTLWSAWARRRYREDFACVARFCLFVGYPRSGHSIVGALLNAHRNAVIAHELNAAQLIVDGCTRDALYSRILARASWFNWRGNVAETQHSYQVPHQWQGRFQTLRVIGDKRGGAVTRCLAAQPEFLDRVRALVACRCGWCASSATRSTTSARSRSGSASRSTRRRVHFRHCQTTARLSELCEPAEVITVHHEQMIHDPRSALSACVHSSTQMRFRLPAGLLRCGPRRADLPAARSAGRPR